MKSVRVLLIALWLGCTARAASEPANGFFAMNTIAKGAPEVVVPLLKELGYDGLGGAAGDRAMAEALRKAGLKFHNGYLTLQFHAERSALDEKLRGQLDAMAGFDTTLWLAISKVSRDGQAIVDRAQGDEIVARQLQEIVRYAAERGVRVSLYHHTRQWFEHFDDAVRMVERLNQPTLGVTFNLCHWLKVEGAERDPQPLLRAAGKRLDFVTINGADTGDTKTMAWLQLIQPLGQGSYDVGAFLKKLRATGYAGPVGFQGFGITAPPREVLVKTMAAWKQMGAKR
jgi:sugar phosphate isomerase/epimerase